ncbi:hypothetical protein ACFE35_28420 [Phormidesmis priestleyi ANT.L61.2]
MIAILSSEVSVSLSAIAPLLSKICVLLSTIATLLTEMAIAQKKNQAILDEI